MKENTLMMEEEEEEEEQREGNLIDFLSQT